MKRIYFFFILIITFVITGIGCDMGNKQPNFNDITIGEIKFEEFASDNSFGPFLTIKCVPSVGEWKPTLYFTVDGTEPTKQSEKGYSSDLLYIPFTVLPAEQYDFTVKVLAVFTDGSSEKTKTGEKTYNLNVKKPEEVDVLKALPLVADKGYANVAFLSRSV